jgi:hypothetical protein
MTIMQDGLDPCLADALLLLATDEGQNLNAYARMAGVSNGVMASYFVELSDRAPPRAPRPRGVDAASAGAPNVAGVLDAEGRARSEAVKKAKGRSHCRSGVLLYLLSSEPAQAARGAGARLIRPSHDPAQRRSHLRHE